MAKSNLPEPADDGQQEASQPETKAPSNNEKRVTNASVNERSGAPDPFDPESLRLGQDFANTTAVKKVLTTVPCRKPQRHEFVRVRPGEDWRIDTALFEDKVNRETFLVDRGLWGELAGEIRPAVLYVAVNRQSDPFLWRAWLPGSDGKSNLWNESALTAAQLAETKWVRVAANMNAGLYDTFEATGNLPEPEWPAESFKQMLELCFGARYIVDRDHPVLRSLRGEV